MSLLSDRILRWLAWSLVGLYLIVMGTSLALMVIIRSPAFGVSFSTLFLEGAVLTVWTFVSVLIISRHPRHPVGWVWCLLPLLVALDNMAWSYAYYGSITRPGSLPGVEIMIVWLYMLFGRQTLGPLGFMLLFLLFPTGRSVSRRWNMLARVAVGSVVVSIPVTALAPNPIGYFPFPRDLFGLSDAGRAILEPLRTITQVLFALCILAAAFSLFVRLARARGVERQQLKWFVYSTLFVAIGFLLNTLGGIQNTPGLNSLFLFGISIMLFGFIVVSIASAIAIFRYRLYDIDLIIRRTLVYSVLTTTLVVFYLGLVILLEAALRRLVGGGSQIATVISTLAIVALSTPLHRRVQDFIDRRFYRLKYNAERALAEFAATARAETDLEALTTQVLAIVQGTMQPEQVSLWLKPDAGKISEQAQN